MTAKVVDLISEKPWSPALPGVGLFFLALVQELHVPLNHFLGI
jgi:hypothetical protein